MPSIPTGTTWAYHHRGELKKRGFRWNGQVWTHPNADVVAKAIAELSIKPIENKEWTVTVHGDGGWKNGIGRSAYLIRHDEGGRWTGVVEWECAGAFEAEVRALHDGVQRAMNLWTAPTDRTCRIYLRTDCMRVVDQVTGKTKRSPEVRAILKLIPKHVHVNTRHVPAHGKSVDGTAKWCNDVVDKLSSMRGR